MNDPNGMKGVGATLGGRPQGAPNDPNANNINKNPSYTNRQAQHAASKNQARAQSNFQQQQTNLAAKNSAYSPSFWLDKIDEMTAATEESLLSVLPGISDQKAASMVNKTWFNLTGKSLPGGLTKMDSSEKAGGLIGSGIGTYGAAITGGASLAKLGGLITKVGGLWKEIDAGEEEVAEIKQLVSPRDFLLNKIENSKLYRIVDNLYRPAAKYGSGSTADAVRHELSTGELLSRTGHITKGIESREALTNLIDSGKLQAQDLQIASWIRKDLQKALTEIPWDKLYSGIKN